MKKGKNSSTCDPWTARDFVDTMQGQSAKCHHCLSGALLLFFILFWIIVAWHPYVALACFYNNLTKTICCLLDCDHITYVPAVTSAELR